MQTTTSSTQIQFPVDDATYDLLQALTSKLESIDAYRTYMDDGDAANREIFTRLAQDDVRQAQQLLEALRRRLASS